MKFILLSYINRHIGKYILTNTSDAPPIIGLWSLRVQCPEFRVHAILFFDILAMNSTGKISVINFPYFVTLDPL